MKVNAYISDLFFHTEHETEDGEYSNLHDEADDFIFSLKNLGVSVPSIEELKVDLINRL